MDMVVTQCEYCPKRFELCWMCIEDHVDKCYACKGLEAEALSTAALLKEHESLQMDLKIESEIAQESKEGLILDYKSLEDYENSFLPTPKDLTLYTAVKTPYPMDNFNNLQTLSQDFLNDLFTGRGSHPLAHSPDIEKVFLAQLGIWSSPSKISVIIPECMTLFDSIGNAGDGYNISYLFHKAVKAVQNNLPHRPKSYKQALMGEFGGSSPQCGSPGIITSPAPMTQFISVTLLNTTVTYSVQFNSHESRGSVVLIDGQSQSKCSTIKAVQNRLNSSAPLFELLLNAPMFISEDLDDFDRNRIIHKYGFILTVHQQKVAAEILDKSLNPKVIHVSLIGNHVFCDDRSFVWNSFMNFLATISFNPQTTAQPQIDHAPTQSIKKFTSISLEGLIDFYSTFSEKHLDFIRNFDMELIGKFKINTVPNILRSDA